METFYPYIITAIVGFITFFLKQTMSRVDRSENSINDIKLQYETKKDHEKDMESIDKDITKIREDYTPIKSHENAVKEIRNDIKGMSETFLKKDDFLRTQANTDKKLDKIMDILFEMKEGK